MKEFYVQVMSNAGTAEFPREPGWQVGVSDLSLPLADRKMNLKNPFLCRITWIECLDLEDHNPSAFIYAHSWSTVRENRLEFAPRTGTELMNMIRDRYHWDLMEQTGNYVRLFKKKMKPEDPTELLYTVMHRDENGQCVLDNTQTCTTIQINGSPAFAKLSIGLELAEKMKWIKMGTLHNGRPGYVLGHGDGESSDRFVETSALLTGGSRFSTQTHPISTRAHDWNGHCGSASGRERRDFGRVCTWCDVHHAPFQA